jgi:predicted  nucleic acid-binding Zn-ribbon protein
VISIDQPLPLLKREADSIKSVIAKVEEDIKKLQDQIVDLTTSKASLVLVCTAIDNEMDRIRQQPEQLELELEVE